MPVLFVFRQKPKPTHHGPDNTRKAHRHDTLLSDRSTLVAPTWMITGIYSCPMRTERLGRKLARSHKETFPPILCMRVRIFEISARFITYVSLSRCNPYSSTDCFFQVHGEDYERGHFWFDCTTKTQGSATQPDDHFWWGSVCTVRDRFVLCCQEKSAIYNPQTNK